RTEGDCSNVRECVSTECSVMTLAKTVCVLDLTDVNDSRQSCYQRLDISIRELVVAVARKSVFRIRQRDEPNAPRWRSRRVADRDVWAPDASSADPYADGRSLSGIRYNSGDFEGVVHDGIKVDLFYAKPSTIFGGDDLSRLLLCVLRKIIRVSHCIS